MSSIRSFKQKLATISRLWRERDYDTALAEVEDLRAVWPGNAHLNVLWASLVQIQEHPRHGLDDAKQALQQALDLDKTNAEAAIELGHFLDAVEDNPRAAVKAYTEGVAAARQLLMDGLIGQAKALLQLDRREDALKCLLEVLHLTDAERAKSDNGAPDIIFRSPTGEVITAHLKGPRGEQIEKLLDELLAGRSA